MRNYYVLLLFVVFSQTLRSQCVAPPTGAQCTGGDGSLPTSGSVNINNSSIYWFTSTANINTAINLNGGKLTVCGNLTISNLNLNSGYIFIEPGASLTINGSGVLNFNNNVQIVNKGTLTINRQVNLQNNGNRIFNLTSSSLLVINPTNTSTSVDLDIIGSNSLVINEGVMQVGVLEIRSTASAGSLCLAAESQTQVNRITTSRLNAIAGPSTGYAYFSYALSAVLNQDLTSSSRIVICQADNSTVSGSGSFITPLVFYNPSVCNITLLPVEYSYFRGLFNEDEVQLYWETQSEKNNDYFSVEYSQDNKNWAVIGLIKGEGNSNEKIPYAFKKSGFQQGVYYFRLKQTDIDGAFSYSDAITLKFKEDSKESYIYPNPNKGVLNIHSSEEKSQPIRIYNAFQQLVFEGMTQSQNTTFKNIIVR